MQIIINVEKKHLAFLVLFIAVIGLTGFTIAYSADGTGGNPSVMGHSFDEMAPGQLEWGASYNDPLVIKRDYGTEVDTNLFQITDQNWVNNQVHDMFSLTVKGNSFFDGPLTVSYGSFLSGARLDLCREDVFDCNIVLPDSSAGNFEPLCMDTDTGVVGKCQ